MTPLLAAAPDLRAVAADAVRENIRRLGVLGERNLAEVLRILQDTRSRLVGMVATGTEFDQARARGMLVEVDREMARLKDLLPPVLARGLRAAATQGDVDTRAQGVYVLGDGLHLSQGVSTHLIDFSSKASTDLVGDVTAKARSALNRAITFGATGASRPADIARQIGTVLAEQGRPTGIYGQLTTQIERVHRTSTADFYEGAARARQAKIAVESPWSMLKKWIAIRDARTRPSHVAMSGVVVPVGAQFDVGGTLCDGPHDAILPAEEVVNCRCSTALVRGERKPGR